ncbi:hypothetical protein ACFQ10_02150 [Streptomyces indonesiensis]
MGTPITRAISTPPISMDSAPAAVASSIPAAAPTSTPTNAAATHAGKVGGFMPLIVPRGRPGGVGLPMTLDLPQRM